MGYIQIAFQRVAAIFPEQLCNVSPVLRSFAPLQKIRQIGVPERTQTGMPVILPRTGLKIFILLAMKLQPDRVFVQKKILHP